MFVQTAERFLERVKEDDDLMARLKELEDEEHANLIRQKAEEWGMDFTAKDLQQAQAGELSEEQLAAVTGGAGQIRIWSEGDV